MSISVRWFKSGQNNWTCSGLFILGVLPETRLRFGSHLRARPQWSAWILPHLGVIKEMVYKKKYSTPYKSRGKIFTLKDFVNKNFHRSPRAEDTSKTFRTQFSTTAVHDNGCKVLRYIIYTYLIDEINYSVCRIYVK